MARKQDQQWHPEFVKYTQFIAKHPVYAGMPDAVRADGTIQWEAPSNRKSGMYVETHQKRREWWRKKAIEVGVDPSTNKWLSKTAKAIHPTKQKPCRRCGRIMELRYAYPSKNLLVRVRKLSYVEESFPLEQVEHITELVARLVTTYGDKVLDDLPDILGTGRIAIPALERNLDAWLDWIDQEYIPLEPSILCPGAMSNAPDRFDGFHHFNLCCRGVADSGRHDINMRTYTTDRRAFEYWTEGDWIAADRLMGLIRSMLRSETCRNGHPGPCSADHIGPVSLGFAHRPEFQMLCAACNSAKNNRMTRNDVLWLKKAESAGQTVTSWYNRHIWDLCKDLVRDDETALRLSKMLRDNRHTALSILARLADEGHRVFLTTYLGLEYADFNVEFTNLRVEEHITHFDQIIHTPRTTKYAVEQKARRCRIGFESLQSYFAKENRNALVISTEAIEEKILEALTILEQTPESVKKMDMEIAQLSALGAIDAEEGFRTVVSQLPREEIPEFSLARRALDEAMQLVAERLLQMWNDDRYVRTIINLDDE